MTHAKTHYDELLTILRNTTWRTPFADLEAMARNVIDGGWHPDEPLEVPDDTELDGYPVGTIVLDRTGAVHVRTLRSFFCWSTIGTELRRSSESLHVDSGPVRLVYSPRIE